MARWDKDTGPTIPEWFFEAIETEYTEHQVEVDLHVMMEFRMEMKPELTVVVQAVQIALLNLPARMEYKTEMKLESIVEAHVLLVIQEELVMHLPD